MSSNGFVPAARSRPRVRQQRATKTSCYAHPRFLQLVKELARLDDAKKKQDELERSDQGPSSGGALNSVVGSIRRTACVINDEPATTSSNSQHSASHRSRPQHHHHPHHYSQPQQRASVVDCWQVNTANCCSSPNESHQMNGCRSLDITRSNSALNDSYYRQNSSNDNSPIATHGVHHHQQNYQQRQYNYSSNHYQNSINNPSSNISHSLQPEYQCLNKSVPSSSATPSTHMSFNCTKIVPSALSTDVSAVELELRQDENRSKRKRTNNDSSATGRKISPSLSPSSSTKRHKSSPEPVRSLSPSFTKCPICLLDCMDRDPSFTNTCFHLFCFVCIENWSKSKATCPLCRTKFNKIVYNIKSASCFDEKVASPVRREDEDDRLIYEQLHSLNANALGAARSSASSEQARQFFDNLRQNHSVLPPQFALIDQTFNRHASSLQNFNSVSNSNFNPSVPHIPFTTASYNPVGSPYIVLDQRSQTANSGPAMYIVNSDSSNRRIPRSGRSPYHRPHEQTLVDPTARMSRSTSVEQNQTGISLGGIRHHHHHHHHHLLPGSQHPSHDQHNHLNPQQHHRSATIELSTRQGQRIAMPGFLPYLMPPRHSSTNVFTRRHYANPTGEQHILNLYGSLPDN